MQINTDRVKNYKITSAIKPSLLKYSCEYRALATLRYLFPNKFETLKHADKPDLQDLINGVGIEVVNAVSEKDMEVNRLLSNMCDNKNISSEQINRLKKGIKACGYDLNDERGLISKTGTGDGDKFVFQESIRKKINKLPIYISEFDKIGLAVVLSDIYSSCLEKECIELIDAEFIKANRSFDFVYVISNRFCCFYDTHKNKFINKYISKVDSESLRKIARMTAEGKLSLSDFEWQ